MQLQPDIPLDPADLSRTLVQTQIRLRRYIMSHYHADQDVLFPRDDPYVSNKELTGCFFAITHWPPDRTKRLTYGMVNIVLTGVLDALYRQERYIGAEVFVVHDFMGMVGFARVAKTLPRLLSPAVSSTS